MGEAIKVICRFRPQNKIEKERNAHEVVEFSDDGTLVAVNHPDKEKHPVAMKFSFDRVFGTNAAQAEVFEYAAKHLVEQIFEGFNATIFAYGQTGAGKTYSMEGQLGSPHRGIVPRTVEHIFDKISEADQTIEFVLKISYVEIYLEGLRDLLNPRNNTMKIREGNYGVYIEGVTEMYVRDPQEVIDLMTMGAGNRTVSSTGMNEVSSRSHGVFMLKLEMKQLQTGTKKIAKLMMVDLAGSEKVAKTGATGQLLEEAKKINQSLSALGNVMYALSTGKGHVAYRDSVLTRLLSDSLGGNCKTTLLIACSPSSYNADETIGTLRFGTRAKKIKNKAKVNVDKTVAEYKKDIAVLTQQLEGLKKKNNRCMKTIAQLKAQVKAAVDAGFAVPDIVLEEDDEDEKKASKKEDEEEEEAEDATEKEEKEKPQREETNAKGQESKEDDHMISQTAQKSSLDMPTHRNDQTNSSQIIQSLSSWDTTKEAELQRSRERVTDAEQRIAELEAQLSAYQSKELAPSTSTSDLSLIKDVKPPQAVSDLSPELLQKARAGLQMENKGYREQIDRLNLEIEKLREATQIREERLTKVLQKSDEIEMECDKLMSQQEIFEETIETLNREKRILERERDEMEKQMQTSKQQLEDSKKRIEQIQREADQKVQTVRIEEAKKANDFVMEAQQKIQAYKRAQTTKESRNPNHNAVGKLRDKYMQDMKAQQRNAQLQETKMKEFEEEMIEEINTMRLEYMQLKTKLESKTEDYVRAIEQVSQKNEEIQNLHIELSVKDEKIKQQNHDLQEFGKMKKQADKIHNDRYQKAQNAIRKLKLQLKKLQRSSETPHDNKELVSPGSNWQQFGYPEPKSDVTSLIEMKRKQTVVVPLRGGGGKKSSEVSTAPTTSYKKEHNVISNGLDFIKSVPNAIKPVAAGIPGIDFLADVMGTPQTVSPVDGPLQEPPFMKQVSRHGRRDSGHLTNRTSSDNHSAW